MFRLLRTIAINVLILGLMLVAVEGLTSIVLLVYDVATTPFLAERTHTQYDPDLGWVNIPNLYVTNLYGPNTYLKTNEQGFRNDQAFDITVPKGKFRILCSGDSFTLGWGVDNDHAWCERLKLYNSRLETVNMGQGGYGVDQAYLWYKRDGSKFQHQIQLLAFITEDFLRMSFDTFWGYAKPVVKEQQGALVITNVPVPRRSYDRSWFTAQAGNLEAWRTLQFINRALKKSGMIRAEARSTESMTGDTLEQTRRVLRKIFADLKHMNETRSSHLVLVYFPVESELTTNVPQEWIDFIQSEAAAQNIILINFFDDFQSLPHKEIAAMYRKKDGHFTERGNEFVAKILYEKLSRHPDLFKLFSPDGRP
ncbi:MAG: hypothetical protein OJF47_003177 [Nitrospira sp.]|jgi:lysophospholipase L1-like esterase|nr:MAG: hypothetical protein OJF47_003177 [Nitrospira sp.]